MLTVFTKRIFVADFLQAKCIFNGNWPFCVLRPPLGNLVATYGDHSKLIGKRVVDFLVALIELFSLGVTSDYWLKIGDFAAMWVGVNKIRVRVEGAQGYDPHCEFSCPLLDDVLYDLTWRRFKPLAGCTIKTRLKMHQKLTTLTPKY